MPKSRKQKEVGIDALVMGLKNAKASIFANFQGLKVSESEELRKACRAEKVIVLATKKTLLRRALEDLGIIGIDPKVFAGGVAVFMGSDEVTAAKVVNTFAKNHEIVSLFGGVLEGKYMEANQVKALAALPSKKELLGQLVGTLNAPISGLVNVLAGNLRGLVSVLNNIKEAKA
jgi:large subunit ribosomal protein L10